MVTFRLSPGCSRVVVPGLFRYIIAMQRVEMEWSTTQIENELSSG